MLQESRALIYLRVSTDRQAQKGIALPTQEERCLAHAAEHGYEVNTKTDLYVDGGESARTMDRPALMDLLTRCKEDKSVRVVIVYDVSRLARNRLDFALIKQALRKEGVTLISATEPIDETPEGQMLEGVLSTVAEFFSAQSARKVKANMRRKAESGGWPCHAPYGYKNRKEKFPSGEIRAWIEPEPEEARWVKRAFELFATGKYSVKTLARKLDQEGILVRRRRDRRTKRFHHSQLERILRNKIYVGIIEWGGIVNEQANHKHLLDPDLFYRVQEALVLRSGSTTRIRRHRSLFKGIAVCDECRSGMTIDLKETSTTRAIRYLRCRKVSKGKPVKCEQRYFNEEVYAEQLERLMGCVELPPQAVEVVQGKLEQLTGEETRVYERARGELERQLETVRARRQNLLLRSLDDDPHDQTQRSLYERVRTELAEEERRLTREIGRLRLRLERIAKIMKMALGIAGCCGQAFTADQDPDYRGIIARVIFKQVRMRDGRIADGVLSDPLAYFRRWAGEKPLERLADLASLGAPSRSVVDGCRKQPQRHISLSQVRNNLLKIHAGLTPAYEDDVESCYHEIRSKNLLP